MFGDGDSWLAGIGVDVPGIIGGVKESATALVEGVKSKGAAVVEQAKGAVTTAAAAVTGGAPKAKPAGPATKPGTAGASGKPGSVSALKGSVGQGGANNPDDVMAVQTALKIAADGKCGGGTIGAIKAFQTSIGQANPDGRVDPGGATAQALASGKGGAATAPNGAPTPAPEKEEGFLDGLKKKVVAKLDDAAGKAKELGGKVVEEVKDLGGKVSDGAKGLGGKVDGGPGGGGGGSAGGARASLGGLFGPKEFDLNVPKIVLPKKEWPALNGKIKIEVQLVVHVSGKVALDDKDTTKLDSNALGLKVGKWWLVGKAEPELAKSNGFWSNLKPFTTDGLAFVATTSVDTAIGKIELKITWVGIENKLEKDALKFEPKALEVEGKLEPVEINLGNQEIEGLKFTGLKIGVGGQVAVGPQWKKIIADMLKDQLKQQFEKWAERAVLSIGADVIIAGSFIIGGIATIAGACYQIAFGFKLKDMTESYASNLKNTEVGFRAGMSDGAAPSDPYGRKGHELGKENLAKLLARTKQQNPQATDEQIKAAVVAKADDATREAINSGEVSSSLKNGMWDGLLAEGKWLFTAKDAATAFQACGLGNDPRFDSKTANSPQWQKYLKQYPTQSKL